MAKDLLFDNRLPTPLAPVDTGDSDADAAIVALQASRPSDDGYDALQARAEAVGPAKLLGLLDDAAIATGQSRWSDEHLASLGTKERKQFKQHYDQVEAALAIRKAYLHWLIGAVCNTPAGLDRAIEILRHGTADARLVAASSLASNLSAAEAKRRVADALDLRTWDGQDPQLERVYRAGVVLLCTVDPAETFTRYAELLRVPDTHDSVALDSLLFGLINAKNADPRWAPLALPHLGSSRRCNLVLMLLEHLPADPSWVEPLCAFLPPPSERKGFWNRNAVKALARAADARALPWLVAALHASWMNWPAVFEGLRRVGDPAMAHVIRDWLRDNGASDRNPVGEAVIAELERNGVAPRPSLDFLEPGNDADADDEADEDEDEQAEGERTRPVLKYEKAPAFEKPKLDSLAKVTKVYAKSFEDAGLGAYFERIAKPAVWMLPKRVDERKLELGATKLGGHPDLPAATKWPRVKGEPLTFLAQIDLEQFAPHLAKGTLPAKGLLSFFMGNDPEGEAGYAEQARVLFTKPRAKLVRHEVPEDFFDVIYQAASVRLHPTLRLPSPSNRQLTKLLKGSKLEAYEASVYDSNAPILPQLLGYRDHGYDAEEPASAEMLLQLPGEDQTDMEFGDADVLAFYIQQKKLAAGDFGKVWPHLGD